MPNYRNAKTAEMDLLFDWLKERAPRVANGQSGPRRVAKLFGSGI